MSFRELMKNLKRTESRPSTMNFLRHLFENQPIDSILQGHLALEGLMIELLTGIGLAKGKVEKMSFPKKVEQLADANILDEKHSVPYFEFNALRNLYAHRLGFELKIEDLLNFVKSVGEIGSHDVTLIEGGELTAATLQKESLDLGIIIVCDALLLELNEKIMELGNT